MFQIVEKPIPHYINNPYPVEVPVPVPVHEPYYIPVEIAKPYPVHITKYLPKPYAVPQPYSVPAPQPIEVSIPQALPVSLELPRHVNKVLGTRLNKPLDPYAYASSYSAVKVPCNHGKEPQRPAPLQSSPSVQNYIKAVPAKNPKYSSASYQNVQHQTYNTIPHQFHVHHQQPLKPLKQQNQYGGGGFQSNQYIGLFPPKFENYPTQSAPGKSVRRHRNARHNFESSIRMEYGFMPPLRPSLEIDEHGQPVEGNS